MSITSGLNLGLPAAPLAEDATLNVELQIVYNALRILQQVLNDAGIPSGGITPAPSVLPVASGGTGAATLTGIVKGTGAAALTAITSSTVGNLLTVTGANTYAFQVPATAGDVVGPAGATIGGIALYDGITGKLIKDLGTGLTTQILVGGGAATNPVWTVATGTGAPVRTTNPTIVTPTIASFANANHDHSNAAGGGAIPAASITGTALVSAAIGTTVQAYDADLTTWAGITPGSGIATFLATPSSANLRAALTDETGTGAAVFATAPTINQANLVGVTDGSSPPAGSLGQEIVSNIAIGSAVSLTNNTARTITSIILTPGTWLVFGTAAWNGDAGTTVTLLMAGINTTTNTLPTTYQEQMNQRFPASTPFGTTSVGFALPGTIFRVASGTTTVYLVEYASFLVGACTGFGRLDAIRIF